MPAPNRPNVLLLMGDEHPVFMTGCYGHRSVRTPTIDRLSATGTTFDAAYCPSPICAPSRAAMMTGRHVHTIEVWDNASPLRSDWPTFAHSFSAAGYHTALCGKMHFVGPDQLHGFDERWTQDIYPATFDWTRSNRAETAVNDGQNIDRVFECGVGWTADMDYDEEIVFRAEYGLRRIARRETEQPFMLCVSFTGPHYPYRAPQRYWDMYSDEDVDLPEIPDNYAELEHEYVRWLRRHGSFDRLVPDEVCRNARRAILGRITMLDDYLGRILGLLKETGLDEDTIVVYTSDHGDMMGEHGLWFKNAAYDWSSRVPLIISGPGIPAQRLSEVVSLLDLGPTLCALAGIEPAYAVSDGRDLEPLVRGHRAEEDGLAIMENYAEGVWRGWRMIRQGPWKMTVVPGEQPELFNVFDDPNEWHDRASDPACREIRDRLEATALRNWDQDGCDERRWQSEERRLAILKTKQQFHWQAPSPPVPHPLRGKAGSKIDNVAI
ncbi:MAG: choline-sulfatase [Lentisphaerae bacterium]|jgi:choline-sulfatase|nr:choline-sulfatase [Lentisphaerota bacterium]MBT4816397.1 choline-sulfatase [Lentisphaerota bacterium]MBT5606844.1 choline-sulfatase [Lentisphaerota bacterium]MBT7055298.1 choline-sulfatase [Lentisphaerota bacterium]MBT7843079.1 choline-sulfatase [Lentisphaerota bacterium]